MQIHLAVVSFGCLLVFPVYGQEWQIKTNEFGQPDMQGLWTNPWMTTLQRPVELGNRRTYTEAEVEEKINSALQYATELNQALDPNRPAPPLGGNIDNSADGNFETAPMEIARVNGEWRTSFIIDPENGRLPYREVAQDIVREWDIQGLLPSSGPEARGPLDRCLAAPSPAPMLQFFGELDLGNPAGDNPVRNIQIIQTQEYVAILSEYFSQLRIIPLKDEFSAHSAPRWMGNSIGHYEGNSLIIRSRQFHPQHSTLFMKSSDEFALQEIYTPIGEDELLFRYTVTDPKVYTRPFTAEIPLRRMPAGHQIYEYACHEGNYSLPSILRAARMEELGFFH